MKIEQLIGQTASELVFEKWSKKYKSSINCSHPKGFSQRAHCQGKKKHNESIEMESVCPDCGMCESHGNLNEIKKGQKDSNGFTKCWPGKHAEGTKKGKNGKPVRNCVPNEGVAEAGKTKTTKKMTWQQAYAHNQGEDFQTRQDRISQYEKSKGAKGEKKSPNTDWGIHNKLKEQGVAEGGYFNRDAYQRDYDSSRTGFGRQHREIDDESNLMYVYNPERERLQQKMVSNHDERSAHQEGFRQTPEQALRLHGIIRSKFDPKKWVQKQGTQWVQVHPYGKPSVAESATAGATSAANIGTVDAPHISPGKARGKKSYTGSPGHSGTKAPPQPKVVQPRKKDGTAVNGLDIKSTSLFGGPKNEAQVIKRR